MDASEHLGLAWTRAGWWVKVSPAARRLGFYDVLSETYLGLVVACQRYDPSMDAKISTYAQYWMDHYVRETIRKNRLQGLSWVPRVRRKSVRAVTAGESAAPPPHDHEADDELWRLVGRLPPQEQSVIRLRFKDGLTLDDAGKAEGITREGLRVRQRRAIQRLRDYYDSTTGA